MGNLTPTISWAEAIGGVICLVGVVLSALAIHDATVDWHIRKRRGVNGDKQIVAMGTIRNLYGRLIILTIVLLQDLASLTEPAAPGGDHWVSDLRVGGRILITFVVLGMTVFDRVDRRVLLDNYVKRHGAVDTAFDAVVGIDAGSLIQEFNPAAERIFGWRASEAIGKPLTALMPERYRLDHMRGMQRVLSGGERRIIGRPVRLWGLTRRGVEVPLEFVVTELRGGDDRVSFTAIMREVDVVPNMEGE